MALVLLDIDHYKLFNDAYGHLAGDDCLKQVATALRATIHRPTDLLARFGGEEFALVLGGTDAAGAFKVAEMALWRVNALNIPHRASPTSTRVTISAGIATTIPTTAASEAEFIKAADQALYQAKASGRNRIVSAAPT